MQPHDNDKRPEEGNSDGRWDHERSAPLNETWLAFQKDADAFNRPMHIAEPGKPCDMSASLSGKGGLLG